MVYNDVLVILMFLTFIAFLFTGFPIGLVLGGVAMAFAVIGYFSDVYLGTLTGLDFTTIGMIVSRVFKLMSNPVLVAVPMFIFMGRMLERSAIAEDMLRSMQDLFGRVHGGLAITVTVVGMILAASMGIIAASVVLLGLLTLPIMIGQGYNKAFATGTVAAAGTLGILIPPSVMLVIMGDQLSLPVGDLFMGAVFPGLLLGGLYILFILGYGLFRPNDLPLPADRKPLNLKVVLNALKTIIPPALLIILVLGSIFMGIATPTEASGVGALGAALLAWYNKKLNFKVAKEATFYTFSQLGFIFTIFVGAQCFALVLRMLGGDEFIERTLTGLPFGPHGILLVIVGVVFLLGFFLDWIEISLIVLPLLGPVISSLGFEINGYGVVDNAALVWFVIIVAMSLQTSFLTPPVGFAIFFVSSTAPDDVKLSDVYKGIIPYVILQLIGLAIVILLPQLVIWLPAMAYK